jgi:hypothetical protein
MGRPHSTTEATFGWRTLAAARTSRKKCSCAVSSPRYRSPMTFSHHVKAILARFPSEIQLFNNFCYYLMSAVFT